MAAMIEELIETERLSSRHRKLNKTRHDIAELINGIVRSHFDGEGINVRLPETALTLDVDAARIKLLLKNLLENAVRYTRDDARAPEVDLRVDRQEVIITISDHGKGIEARHLPHLTEPFYRADPSRQRETGGYGLGLYLCKMIAKAHGGRLAIDSITGEGTRVMVKLPI